MRKAPRFVLSALSVLAGASPAARAQTAPEATPPPASSVQLAPLPNTAQFNRQVDLRTSPAGESLDALVQALARSVGLSAITQGIPADAVVCYDLGEPQPFREVWDIVLTLNGLKYVLRGNDIVMVGPPKALAGLRPLRDNEKTRIKVTYQVNRMPDRLKTLLQNQFPTGSDVTIDAFNGLGLISVQGTPVQQMRVRAVLDRFDQTSVRRTYSLNYAKADVLARVLVGTLSSSSQDKVSEVTSVPDLCPDPKNSGSSQTSLGADTGASENPFAAPQAEDSSEEETNQRNQPPISVLADTRTNRVIVNGLVQNQLTESTRKVPGLGDVPVLGELFTTTQGQKTTPNCWSSSQRTCSIKPNP